MTNKINNPSYKLNDSDFKITRLVDEIGQLTNNYSLYFIKNGNRTMLEQLKQQILKNQKLKDSNMVSLK